MQNLCTTTSYALHIHTTQ